MNEARKKKLRSVYKRLPRINAAVGIAAGVLSVGGFLYPFWSAPPSRPGLGDIVAVVQDAQTRKPVNDASVEILTSENAVVTTVTSKDEGRARQSVKEGGYTLRVTHPRFAAATRKVQVHAGQTAEIQVALSALPPPRASSSASSSPAQAVNEGVGQVKKFFRGLGN